MDSTQNKKHRNGLTIALLLIPVAFIAGWSLRDVGVNADDVIEVIEKPNLPSQASGNPEPTSVPTTYPSPATSPLPSPTLEPTLSPSPSMAPTTTPPPTATPSL